MKTIVVGDWHSDIHEEAVYRAFVLLGHEVYRVAWNEYFYLDGEKTSSIAKRIQRKYMFGPIVAKINSDLIALVERVRPDLLFIYRGTHIYPSSLSKIKSISPATLVLSYNNDDPFSPKYPKWMWRHYIKSLPLCDNVLVYRASNIEDAKRYGAINVDILRSWYLPWKDVPVILDDKDKEEFGSDVAFVGHFERDGRLEACEAILRKGIDLKIFGPYKGLGKSGWYGHIKKDSPIFAQTPLRWLGGNDYVKAISGTKIGLCFLSKLNRDTYTRRCFEIPACGTSLFSEYSSDLASLFEEGLEIEFFRSRGELLEKIEFYLKNPKLLSKLANAGSARLVIDGHDVVSRMRDLLCKL